MVILQFFNGVKWLDIDTYNNEFIALATLGDDNSNYRIVDESGKILTCKLKQL